MFSTEAIVIRATRYTSNSFVVKAFSKEHGIINFMLRSSAKNKRSALKEQLSILELSFAKPLSDRVASPSQIKLHQPYTGLALNPVKRTIALFMSEIIDQCIKQESADLESYNYIKSSLLKLDTAAEFNDFHIQFMAGLMSHLGISPGITNETYLDLQEGKGRNHIPLHELYLNEQETIAFVQALNGQKSPLPIRKQLNNFLLYFKIHMSGFKDPKSLDVLTEVFAYV